MDSVTKSITDFNFRPANATEARAFARSKFTLGDTIGAAAVEARALAKPIMYTGKGRAETVPKPERAAPVQPVLGPDPPKGLVKVEAPPGRMIPTLQNTVATVNLGCRLDLQSIAMSARNAEYNPKRFAAVILRIRDPKATALVFASGKMVITGAKNEDSSKLAARKFARIIQKLGYKARFGEFKIQNMVGCCDARFPIRLCALASRHHNFSSYEPELFPGLIYRMVKPGVVLLIFVSGKVVMTGARTREEIYAAWEMIYPVLQDFCKKP